MDMHNNRFASMSAAACAADTFSCAFSAITILLGAILLASIFVVLISLSLLSLLALALVLVLVLLVLAGEKCPARSYPLSA